MRDQDRATKAAFELGRYLHRLGLHPGPPFWTSPPTHIAFAVPCDLLREKGYGSADELANTLPVMAIAAKHNVVVVGDGSQKFFVRAVEE